MERTTAATGAGDLSAREATLPWAAVALVRNSADRGRRGTRPVQEGGGFKSPENRRSADVAQWGRRRSGQPQHKATSPFRRQESARRDAGRGGCPGRGGYSRRQRKPRGGRKYRGQGRESGEEGSGVTEGLEEHPGGGRGGLLTVGAVTRALSCVRRVRREHAAESPSLNSIPHRPHEGKAQSHRVREGDRQGHQNAEGAKE